MKSSLASFETITSAENLFDAWNKFRRGKGKRYDILNFEHCLEQNIFELQKDLRTGRYEHGQYTPFRICDPKQRQIHKAKVRDRLVHQAITNVIEPVFEREFIYDSFSCRKGKGTHSGGRRLRYFLEKTSWRGRRPAYALKCDIGKFFASVDHVKLLSLLSNRIADTETIKLLEKVIASFEYSPGKGLPLGNLTSQLFANIYMHQFDFFAKHRLRQKYYIRYCDDFVIVDANRKHLVDLIEPIKQFLETELELQLHPRKITIRSFSQGVDFLGYISKPYCTLLRTQTKHRLLAKVNHANLSSYLGVLSHSNSFELRQQVITKVALTNEHPYLL